MEQLECLRDGFALGGIQLDAAHRHDEGPHDGGNQGDAVGSEPLFRFPFRFEKFRRIARRLLGVEQRLGMGPLHPLVALRLLLVRGALEVVREERR